jgi:hypothetical protein
LVLTKPMRMDCLQKVLEFRKKFGPKSNIDIKLNKVSF